MNKIILFLLITFTFVSLYADLEFELRQATPEVYKTKSTDFYHIDYKSAMSRGEIGEPALPWISMAILLPPDEEAVSIELEFDNYIERILLGDVYPNQPVNHQQNEGVSEFRKNELTYKSDSYLPQQVKGMIANESWFGFNILMTSYCPVKYNPLKKELRYYEGARIKIITRKVTRNFGEQAKHYDPAKAAMVADFVMNKDILSAYPVRENRDLDPDILIITPEEFLEEFVGMQDFYQLYGWQSEIVTTEFIETNLQGTDLQEKIRNHIINSFNEYGISYVLLGGDVEHIPYRGFYCQVESSEIYEDYDIPSDLYYSALDGTWDDNNNGNYGEIGEDDLLPEVAVARLPFSDASELANMLNKTVIYSQIPVVEDLDKPLMLGELLWADPITWGADYLDLLIGWHDDNGYETSGIPEDSDYIYLTERDQGEWDMTDLFATLAEGVSFVHHSGHSNDDYMMQMHTEDVIESNFATLNGIEHNMPIIYSHGCVCGAFDYDDCIAEEAMKLPVFTSGLVVNSRYGWFNEGQSEGPSGHIHREFMTSLYQDKENHIGMAHLLSKVRTAPWLTAPGQHELGAIRWCFYDCNVIADPVLPIWTDVPQGITVNYPSEIEPDITEMNIYIENQFTNEPGAGFRAALLQDGVTIGMGIADTLGICNILIASEIMQSASVTLIVNGYNILPQQYLINVNATDFNEDDVPASTLLLKNYPNPFNPSTEISFYLEETQEINLSIYSIRGQLVKTIAKGSQTQGDHTINWEGIDNEGNVLNSGIYIARLLTPYQKEEIKMLLVK